MSRKSIVALCAAALFCAVVALIERPVDAHPDVLEHLAVDRGQTGTVLLKVRQCSLLVVQTGTSARLLIRCLSFFKKVVVQPAAFIKSSIHDCLLSRCRVQAVLECFTHTYSMRHKRLKPLKHVKPLYPRAQAPRLYGLSL